VGHIHVQLIIDSHSNQIPVKAAKTPNCAELIRWRAAILETLKHPLVLE
jgi:hypothetical protein